MKVQPFCTVPFWRYPAIYTHAGQGDRHSVVDSGTVWLSFKNVKTTSKPEIISEPTPSQTIIFLGFAVQISLSTLKLSHPDNLAKSYWFPSLDPSFQSTLKTLVSAIEYNLPDGLYRGALT